MRTSLNRRARLFKTFARYDPTVYCDTRAHSCVCDPPNSILNAGSMN